VDVRFIWDGSSEPISVRPVNKLLDSIETTNRALAQRVKKNLFSSRIQVFSGT
jgi:hypothetical protein